jgi:methionine-gamma-lyase
MSKKKTETILSRDEPKERNIHSHIAPLYLSSTYIYPSVDEAQEVFKGKKKAHIYGRWSHPNAELAEEKLEAMQANKNTKALLFSSGMAAIAAVFQALIKPGDKILVQGNIYGTTIDYLNHFSAQTGFENVYADLKNLNEVEALFKKHKFKVLYCETPSNPTIACYDLEKLSSIAHKYGAKVVVDNTFATPLLQQPLHLGADFEIDSSTKFLNGHGTGISGAVIGADKNFMEKDLWKIRKLNGSIISPMDAWLLNLGMKTLSVRMEKHCSNAMKIAEFLSKHKAVKSVNYLGLKSHPDHKLAAKQMCGFSGVLSFELKDGYKAAKKLMGRVKLCHLTASLGTTDTLIQHPASMSHYFVTKKQRDTFGITDGLVRLSVGLENAEDIIDDLERAMR